MGSMARAKLGRRNRPLSEALGLRITAIHAACQISRKCGVLQRIKALDTLLPDGVNVTRKPLKQVKKSRFSHLATLWCLLRRLPRVKVASPTRSRFLLRGSCV